MTDGEPISVEAEIVDTEATAEIAKAVRDRRSAARRYVLWVRRRYPTATPAEVIQVIEGEYSRAISAAGAVISAGAIAADVGLSLLAAALTKGAGQAAAKQGAKAAMKGAGVALAKFGGPRLIAAGDAQLQFKITAIYALAVADIHGMVLDKEKAHALVYGLSNGRVSQQQIATIAADIAKMASDGDTVATDHTDWSHWAKTLADNLPEGGAKTLVEAIQTGRLNVVRGSLSGKKQAVIDYGIAALVGGVTRFLFGREVIAAAKIAFPDAPSAFAEHLAEVEPNRALVAVKNAAASTGHWIAGTAKTVGGGVATGAVTVGERVKGVFKPKEHG